MLNFYVWQQCFLKIKKMRSCHYQFRKPNISSKLKVGGASVFLRHEEYRFPLNKQSTLKNQNSIE